MFERFTKDARAVVVEAQQVARELRSPRIDTRHLLVALAGAGRLRGALRTAGLDPDDVARRGRAAIAAEDALDATALAGIGIDLDAVRTSTDALFGPGALDDAARPRRGVPGHIPFTPDAKKALELGLREAIRLREKTIDLRHLLLGILRADSPGGQIAAAAATEAGLDLPALRATLERSDPTAA
ncbi:Clp domain protein [Xylanimonas cellulosilytica DSM 15894]|uniref:Clp domain protein n=1 Tax=Xylanimonas cellulosilytica (strain DSM 15894 / JCM 12276 / CECT 5975 / KCTC 9989 / LMG 20990 / NBRC 107835 / XIL07) TaxID=446471 RepID=D1BXF4_XYLCX|nr:Clp protease N-terminal domain-containing protein [Xylanimonas cellulosilytica]ACZ29764.1 Clp domain protein [Xylanimonas cellulosilytica DSM 15894]